MRAKHETALFTLRGRQRLHGAIHGHSLYYIVIILLSLTMCFKLSKPIQIGLCMLMSLSIQLHGLHLDAQICRHNYAVERGLVVDFCGQPHCCYRPYYPTARFPSPSSCMVSVEPFPERVKAHVLLTCTDGISPNHIPVIVAGDRR